MDDEIRPFSESISTGEDQVDSDTEVNFTPDDSMPDTFSKIASPIARRRLYQKWSMMMVDGKLQPGYERIRGKFEVDSGEVDKIADKAFAGQDLSDEEDKILKTGWPELFKKSLK